MKNRKLLEVTLEHYRVHINEYDRWLAEFPDVCRVLENLKAQSEWHSGLRPVDISELRNELRNMRSGRTSAAAGASQEQAEPVAVIAEGPEYRWVKFTDASIGLPAGTKLYTHPSAELAALRERIAGMEKDAERLDWLDATNTPFKMGWHVGVAPAGNVSVRSIICLGARVISIREAIDTAKEPHP